ncbi:MAG: hypothetical protein E6J27_04445 [Chloroflexi bacterium]|nr:MAG: hypothetical protein E6J27_04445 [Chloroflexota bacterium]
MNEKTIAVREAADDQDPGGTLARRTLLGAIGLATIGGLTAGVLGLTGRAAGPTRLSTASSVATQTPTHSASHAVTAAPVSHPGTSPRRSRSTGVCRAR